MAWIVKGSFVLDKLLNVQRSADVDVFHEGNAPTEAEIRRVLNVPAGKSIEISKDGFQPKFNLDLFELRSDGQVYDDNGNVGVPPAEIKLVAKYFTCDDAIRILKTWFKYGDKLTLSKSLKNKIVKEIKDSISDGLDSAITAQVVKLMPQEATYRKMREFLKVECRLRAFVDDNLPELPEHPIT